MTGLPTPFPMPSLRPSTHRPLNTSGFEFPPWSPLVAPPLTELLLTALEPVLVAITLSGHKATNLVVVLESTDGNPQHSTQLSIDLQYWHVGNATSAMRGDARDDLLARISDRAAGYIAVSYYPRPGFGTGSGFPSIISLDSITVPGAAPVQVLDILGANPGFDPQLHGRWFVYSLGAHTTAFFSETVAAATTAACDRIVPILDAAGPDQGFRYVYDPLLWSVNPGPPTDPSLDEVARLIRTTSLDQSPHPQDWLRQEVLGLVATRERLEVAAGGDATVLAELDQTVRSMIRPTAVPQIPNPPATGFESSPGTEVGAATWTAFLMALHTIDVINLYRQIPHADFPAPAEEFFGSWDDPTMREITRRMIMEGWGGDEQILLPLMFWLIGCAGATPTSADIWAVFDNLNRVLQEDWPNLSDPMPDPCTTYRVAKFAACLLKVATGGNRGAEALTFWIDGRARDPAAMTFETFTLPNDARGIETVVGYKQEQNALFVEPHRDRIIAWLARECTEALWEGIRERLKAPPTQVFPADPDNFVIANTVPVGQGPSPLSGLIGTQTATDTIYPPSTHMRFRAQPDGAETNELLDNGLFYFGGVTIVSEVTVTATAGAFSAGGVPTWHVQLDSWRIRVWDRIDFNPNDVQPFLSGDLGFIIEDDMFLQLTTNPCPGKPEPMDFYAMTEGWYELFEPGQPLDELSPRELLIPETPVPDPAGGPDAEMVQTDGTPFVITPTTFPGPPVLAPEIPLWDDLPSMPTLPTWNGLTMPSWVPGP